MALGPSNFFYSDLFGLGSLGNLQNAYNQQLNHEIDRQRLALMNRRAQVANKMIWENSGGFLDVDKYGKTGIESMEEGARPVVALRREIEGWLPKL